MKNIFCLFLLLVSSTATYSQNYDLNDDGSVNSSDVVLLYNYISNGGTSGGGDTLVVGPSDVVVDETFYWEAAVAGVYSYLSQFEEARRALEKLRLEKQKDHPIRIVIKLFSKEMANEINQKIHTLTNIDEMTKKAQLNEVVKELQHMINHFQVALKLMYARTINFQLLTAEKDEFINLIISILFQRKKFNNNVGRILVNNNIIKIFFN